MKISQHTGFFCLLAFLSGIVPPALRAADVEARIREIRAKYESVENAKLSKKTISFEGEDEPVNGECTFYRQGDQIVKVVFTYGGDHGANDESYYYDGGRLFFVHASDGAWNFTGRTLPNGESETVDSVTEHRVYVDGGAIIRHLVKEAQSTDGAKLPGILAKTENKPGDSGERAQRLVRIGDALLQVSGPKDLEKVLMAQ